MPRGGANRASLTVKRRYFELIQQGVSGSAASLEVGVSLSCGPPLRLRCDNSAPQGRRLPFGSG